MKELNFSSLHLFLMFMIVLSCSSYDSYAQNANDSLWYYYDVIFSPSGRSDLPEAVSYYQKNLEQCYSNKDTLGSIYALNLIATGLFELNYLYDSEEAAVSGINLIDQAEYRDTLRYARNGFYVQLGKIYRSTKNWERALAVYNDALSGATKSRESIVLINNKANVYKDQKQYALAKEQLELAFAKVKMGNDSLLLARVLDNLGFVQTELGEPGALNNLERALEIRTRTNDYSGMYASQRSLYSYYRNKGDTTLAKFHAEETLKLALSLNRSSYRLESLAINIELSGDSSAKGFKHLSDSLSKVKQQEENRYAFMKYNLDNEKKITEAARLSGAEEKRKKVIYQAFGAIILLSAIFIIILLRLKFKREKAQQVFNTEARISKKVHDEVANDVYHVMTKLQTKTSAQEELLDDLEGIYNKTRDISKEGNALDVEMNFSELLSDLLLSYQNTEVNVITKNLGSIDWNTISNLKRISIYRVLQELMTNMRKHSSATLVVLTATQSGRRITITYTDNGVGAIVKKKNGLENAENRMKAINGTISFDSKENKGFNAIITI
jgi:signal transduction histidine kinase